MYCAPPNLETWLRACCRYTSSGGLESEGWSSCPGSKAWHARDYCSSAAKLSRQQI